MDNIVDAAVNNVVNLITGWHTGLGQTDAGEGIGGVLLWLSIHTSAWWLDGRACWCQTSVCSDLIGGSSGHIVNTYVCICALHVIHCITCVTRILSGWLVWYIFNE